MKRTIRCIIWVQIIIMVLLSAFNASAENRALNNSQNTDSGLLKIAEKNNLEMYLDDDTVLYIKDKTSGNIWCSAPQTGDNVFIDENILAEMNSLISVRYANSKNVYFNSSSKQSSVDEKTYKIKKYKDNSGAVIEYNFTKNDENFTIPLNLQLNEDSSLTVEILYNEIKEEGSFRIVSIDLLPYMLSGNKLEKGYLVVPDGSGAIMNFDDNKATAKKYEKSVYGRDYALNLLKDTTDEREIALPVYGCSKENKGIFCIIEESESNAFINAIPSGYTSDCAAVWASFHYRCSDTTTLADKNYNSRSVTVISDKLIDKNPKLKLSFLSGESDYNAMANLYRNYLLNEKGMNRITNAEPKLYLQIMGAVKKSDNFLGIPIKKTVTATDFEDVSQMLTDFKKAGITDTELMLYGFLKGGMYGKYTSKLSFDKKVGSKSEFKQLLKESNKNGSSITVMFDMMNVYSGKLAFLNAAKMLDKQTLFETRYYLSTGVKDDSFKWFLLKPQKLNDNISKLVKNLKKNDISSVGLTDVGHILYSDYNKSNISLRHNTQEKMQKALKNVSKQKIKSITEGGNLYSLYSSSSAVETPVVSSNFDCFSKRIPFYQISLHGLVKLAGEAINYQGNSEVYYLQSVQTGTDLVYMLTGKDSGVYAESKLDYLYNSYYKNHIDDIADKYAKYKTAFKELQNQFITSFEEDGAITVTTFENGKKIICNFSSNELTYHSVLIPPMDFIVE